MAYRFDQEDGSVCAVRAAVAIVFGSKRESRCPSGGSGRQCSGC